MSRKKILLFENNPKIAVNNKIIFSSLSHYLQALSADSAIYWKDMLLTP